MPVGAPLGWEREGASAGIDGGMGKTAESDDAASQGPATAQSRHAIAAAAATTSTKPKSLK
jgi:hypothetical protein